MSGNIWRRLSRKVVSDAYNSDGEMLTPTDIVNCGLSIINPVPEYASFGGSPVYGSTEELRFNICSSNLAATYGCDFVEEDWLLHESPVTRGYVYNFVKDNKREIAYAGAAGVACALIIVGAVYAAPVAGSYFRQLLSVARFSAASRGPASMPPQRIEPIGFLL